MGRHFGGAAVTEGECGVVPCLLSYTLAFALQLRKNHEKTSVRAAEMCQLGTIRTEDCAAEIAASTHFLTFVTFGLRFS